MQKIKKALLNPWVVSVFSPIITTIILSGFTALIKDINFFEAFQLLLSWILKIANFKMPLYVIGLVIIFLIGLFKIYIKFEEVKHSNKYAWLNHTKEHYKNWVLKWEYKLGDDKRYSVENLRAICECGCELTMKREYKGKLDIMGFFVCPNCEKIYSRLGENTLEDFHKKLSHHIMINNYPENMSE